jgi:hypothetical protein
MSPVIALAGESTWLARLSAWLSARDFAVARCEEPDRFIDQLLDEYPALLLVDSRAPHWTFWITALKTEQATRRIPALAVGEDDTARQQALAAGADAYLIASEPGEPLLQAIRDHARFPDPATLERLRCQCQEALPPLARLGVERFNAGDYYAQHDAFEEQWMAESGPVRDLYRAILQVGVAYYHITRGNHAGGLKMLRRSAQWFAALPDECQGVDTRQLREDAARARAALQAMDPADIASFDRAMLAPVKLIDG